VKLLCASERNRCNPHPAQDGDYSGFVFSEQTLQAAFWQFVYAPAKEIRDCKGNILFAAGFPIGARAALLAHDFALQSLVCYTFASG
jgi:hypothetical protein